MSDPLMSDPARRFLRSPDAPVETPEQLELRLYTDELDVAGHYDMRRPGIRYIGKARKQNNGLWTCLANVGGALCLVEVTIHPTDVP